MTQQNLTAEPNQFWAELKSFNSETQYSPQRKKVKLGWMLYGQNTAIQSQEASAAENEGKKS